MPDGDKCYEKKNSKRTVEWESDSGKNGKETILDRQMREEISITMTFEQWPKAIRKVDMYA